MVSSLRLHMVEMVSSHFGDAAVGRADVGRSGSIIPFVLPAVFYISGKARDICQSSLLLPSTQPRKLPLRRDPSVALLRIRSLHTSCGSVSIISPQSRSRGNRRWRVVAITPRNLLRPAKLRRRVLEQRLTWRDCRSSVEIHTRMSCYACVAGNLCGIAAQVRGPVRLRCRRVACRPTTLTAKLDDVPPRRYRTCM